MALPLGEWGEQFISSSQKNSKENLTYSPRRTVAKYYWFKASHSKKLMNLFNGHLITSLII